MAFVLKDKNESEVLLHKIRVYLETQLLLKLHPNKIHLRKVRQGIDFLGYVILPRVVVLRTTTKKRIYQKLQRKEITKQNIDSYLSVATHAKGRLLVEKLLNHKALAD